MNVVCKAGERKRNPAGNDVAFEGWDNGDSFNVSNGHYYTQCKFKMRTSHMNRKIEKINLSEFMNNMPSSKTASSVQSHQYFLRSHQDQQEQLFELQYTRNSKHYRWKTYIHRQKDS